jgi:hypothetical protein
MAKVEAKILEQHGLRRTAAPAAPVEADDAKAKSNGDTRPRARA